MLLAIILHRMQHDIIEKSMFCFVLFFNLKDMGSKSWPPLVLLSNFKALHDLGPALHLIFSLISLKSYTSDSSSTSFPLAP